MDFSKYSPRVFSFEYGNDILWYYNNHYENYCSQFKWNNTIVTKINYCRNVILKLTNKNHIDGLIISETLYELINSLQSYDRRSAMLMNINVKFSRVVDENTITVFNSEYKMNIRVINYKQNNI